MTKQLNFGKDFFIVVLTFFISLNLSIAQFSIEPELGMNYTKITGYGDPDVVIFGDLVSNRSYDEENLFVGINLSRKISERVDLNMMTSYSYSVADFSDTGFVGYTNLRFKQVRFILEPRVEIFKNSSLAFGFCFNRLMQSEIGFDYRNIWNSLDRDFYQNQLGRSVSISHSLKSFRIGLRYVQLKSINNELFSLVNKSDNFSLSLSYVFRIKPKSNP